MAAPSSQRQFLVKVSGISEYFDSKTGGETSSEVSKHHNGGILVPDILAAPPETDNIVVTRGWKHDRDAVAHRSARKKVGFWRTTIVVTPTNESLVAIGTPTTYTNALLVRVSEPDYDASSGDPATFELEFAVGAVV
jgi:hypothetical protein